MPSGDGDFLVGLTLPPRPNPTPVGTPVPAAAAAHARACDVSTPEGTPKPVTTASGEVPAPTLALAKGLAPGGVGFSSDPKPLPPVGDGELPPPTPPKRGCGPLSPRVSFLGLGFSEFG